MSAAPHLVRLFGFRVDATFSLFAGDPPHTSIDLSKATRLQDIEFWCGQLRAKWVTMTLRTVTSKHKDLQKIFIHIYHRFTPDSSGASIRKVVGETTYREWLDLDRLLVEFWESRSIRPKVKYACASPNESKGAIDGVACLLPEITKRGIADLVEYYA